MMLELAATLRLTSRLARFTLAIHPTVAQRCSRPPMPVVRVVSISILLVMLLTGCDRDAKLSRQMAGTWTHEGYFTLTLSSDGNFSSVLGSISASNYVAYVGTWLVKDELLVMTTTNASGTRPHEPIGTVDRLKIVMVDHRYLALESGGQTGYYDRK
jgi:hypothetical protein